MCLPEGADECGGHDEVLFEEFWFPLEQKKELQKGKGHVLLESAHIDRESETAAESAAFCQVPLVVRDKARYCRVKGEYLDVYLVLTQHPGPYLKRAHLGVVGEVPD